VCHDETEAKRPAKDAARTALVAALKTKLTAFVAALKIGARVRDGIVGAHVWLTQRTRMPWPPAEFASKVLLPTKDQATGKPDGGSSSPVATPAPAASTTAAAPAPAPKATPKASGVTVKLEVDLLARCVCSARGRQCPGARPLMRRGGGRGGGGGRAQDIYEALTLAPRVQIWTQAPAVVGTSAGAELQLYGGNVTGQTLEAIPGRRLRQRWRLQSWPAGAWGCVGCTDRGQTGPDLRVASAGQAVPRR
jgi:hypothetical protein